MTKRTAPTEARRNPKKPRVEGHSAAPSEPNTIEPSFTELARYAYAIAPFLSFEEFKRLRLLSKGFNSACMDKEVMTLLV